MTTRLLALLFGVIALVGTALPASAADSTSFNPLSVSVQAQPISGVPIGTVISWPVYNNPEGWNEGNWLECNGQSISSSAYPELYAVVGGSVPDLRGLFLRGVGGNAASLGSVQEDAIRNITGGIGVESGKYDVSGVFTGQWGTVTQSGDPIWNVQAYFDASRVVPTAEENRPVNMSVRYLIRARP